MNEDDGTLSVSRDFQPEAYITEQPQSLSDELRTLMNEGGPRLLAFLSALAPAIDAMPGWDHWEPLIATGFCTALLDLATQKRFYHFDSGHGDEEPNSYTTVHNHSPDIDYSPDYCSRAF